MRKYNNGDNLHDLSIRLNSVAVYYLDKRLSLTLHTKAQSTCPSISALHMFVMVRIAIEVCKKNSK